MAPVKEAPAGLGLGAPPLSRPGLLAWTRRALSLAGVRPDERRGQHFLVDPAVVRAFLSGLRGWHGEPMMEVGVGLGALTHHVASGTGSRILGVEVDPALAPLAASHLPGNAVVVVADGLDLAPAAPVRVVYSNTPYNISGRLVAALARNNDVALALLMVQKEVAWRLLARPGEGEYGRLTVIARLFFRVELLGVFGPRSFYPPPRVDSALVRLERVKPWIPGVHDRLEDLARCLFTQRNRLALRVLKRCGADPGRLRGALEGRRVRDLDPWTLEGLAAGSG